MAITPYLLYEDVDAAMKFLGKAFGFRKHGPVNRGPDGTIYHATMQLDDHFVMMGYPGPKYKNPKRLGQATFNIYVDVADADKHFARAQKAGAHIIEQPANTPYGARRYGAEDPEGHQWYFAHELARKPARK
jgi:uncharacterized glyoxalase superfamily protein PhnB